jgi:hypothetical protein
LTLAADLGTFDAVIILAISVPAFIVATRITNPKLRTLSMLLALFLIIHGAYHAIAVLGGYYGSDLLGFLSEGVIEPLSYLVMLAFAYRLLHLGDRQ